MRSKTTIDRLVSSDAATEAALKACSLACKEVVAAYLSEEQASRNEFGRRLLRAAAAIEAAAAKLDADAAERRSTFAIAAPICRAAAEECRRSPPHASERQRSVSTGLGPGDYLRQLVAAWRPRFGSSRLSPAAVIGRPIGWEKLRPTAKVRGTDSQAS